MNNKEVYREVQKILKSYTDFVGVDKDDLQYYESQLKSGQLNGAGVQATRSKIAEVKHSMNRYRDKARGEIDKAIKEFIDDNFKIATLEPTKLDLDLVNLLNAGFNLSSDDILSLVSRYSDYTNKRLIADYVEREEIQLPMVIDTNSGIEEREAFSNNYNVLMSTATMGDVRHGLDTPIDTELATELFANILDVVEV